MPTSAQLQKIWLLSDTVLYPEAVAFIQNFVKRDFCQPLPASQMAGLLNIAEALQYKELQRFVTNQRLRSWPRGKEHIGIFYKELEEQLKGLYNRLVQDQFHLLSDERGVRVMATNQDVDLLMARLAREYIQHLVAENNDQAARVPARPH
jgi:hypothetical protein